MANAIDYIKWRGDLNFKISPINEIDLFLFSQVCMTDFEGIVSDGNAGVPLSAAAREYFRTHDTDVRKNIGVIQAMSCLEAFKLMGESERFGNVLLSNYENHVDDETEEQFSATTFRISSQVLIVAFRGTDDTIIGWKEDCKLAIYDEVPAQRDAKEYLEKIAAKHSGRLVVLGHSKGGNLAVYAAVHSAEKTRERILRIINFDGPGQRESIISGNGAYASVRDRITTIRSENSTVGTLLELPGTSVVVKTGVEGLLAHDGFQWDVELNHFTRAKGLSLFSRTFGKTLKKTMASMGEEEMLNFVEELFSILFSTGAETITDFQQISLKQKLQTASKTINSKAVRDFSRVLLKALVVQ